jgi:hypothetical protein
MWQEARAKRRKYCWQIGAEDDSEMARLRDLMENRWLP